jgi:hypothetical protein
LFPFEPAECAAVLTVSAHARYRKPCQRGPGGTAKANNKVGAKDNQALSLLRRGANGEQTVQRTVGISFWNKLSPIGEILFEEEIQERVLSLDLFQVSENK